MIVVVQPQERYREIIDISEEGIIFKAIRRKTLYEWEKIVGDILISDTAFCINILDPVASRDGNSGKAALAAIAATSNHYNKDFITDTTRYHRNKRYQHRPAGD